MIPSTPSSRSMMPMSILVWNAITMSWSGSYCGVHRAVGANHGDAHARKVVVHNQGAGFGCQQAFEIGFALRCGTADHQRERPELRSHCRYRPPDPLRLAAGAGITSVTAPTFENSDRRFSHTMTTAEAT